MTEYPVEGPGSPATALPRSMARLTDFVLSVLVPWGLVGAALSGHVKDGKLDLSTTAKLAVLAILLVIPFLYETVFVAWRGQTPGKMIGGLRVTSRATGEVPTVRDAAVRALIPLPFLGAMLFRPVFLIGYVAVFASAAVARGLPIGWHDRVAGTIVVRTR
jgi:uncharacterized RDD family membrane protein YckC